ncbi:tetratricopeptide repeat protein [uncultured Novosphingobium sp.]|uniref:tetratricopeptide repeat protein n=1 Tax=uncultured Novosphingobium sp. TaxID=292277 RepID=UPI00258A3176|nr:tetratricopeptide repeat protein [uncultured Novosphingobium sp.]
MAVPPQTPVTNAAAARRQSEQSGVFMREVDDALRQDQFETFLRRYGKLVIAAIVIGLLAFAAYLFWHHRQKAEAEGASEQLVLALDDLDAGNAAKAQQKLAALTQTDAGHAALARLAQAGIALDKGRADEAAKLYSQVASDTNVGQPVRDLATVREVGAAFDKLPPQTVVDRLSALAQPGTAWFGVAGEMVGMAYLKQGKPKEAGLLFVKIAKDKTQPDGLRTRVRQLAGQLGYDALDDVVPVSDEDGAPAQGSAGE